jgi:hypothetical protein
LAFAGKQVNPTEPHSVVWAGVITEKMSFAEYWDDRRFAGKKPDRSEHPDNFYRPVDPTLTAAGYKEAIFVDGTGTYTHPAEGSCI